MADSCATCFFFASQTYTDPAGNVIVQGGCHRFAPDLKQGPGQAQWPRVQGTDWCGDWLTSYPTGLVWTSFSSIVQSTVGAITTLTLYASPKMARFGKGIWFRQTIGTTVNGTGAGMISMTLPSVPAAMSDFHGATCPDSFPGGPSVQLVGYCNGNTNIAYFTKFDGTYPGANNTALTFSGFYQEP